MLITHYSAVGFIYVYFLGFRVHAGCDALNAASSQSAVWDGMVQVKSGSSALEMSP